ncbi:MAG TPA: alpha/beta hydrolase [Acidobacteriota bacterium]|nr:alpha/beta hydrolase [Acidobacteriota bacterium]
MNQSRIAGLWTRERQSAHPSGDIVLIHGLGESSLCFERLINTPRLKSWSFWAPDLPGYGQSEADPSCRGLQQQAARLARWIEELRLRRVVLAGHSMGGVVATLLWEEHPRLAQAFVNIEGNISPGDCHYSAQAAAYDKESFVKEGFEALGEKIRAKGQDDPAHLAYFESYQKCDPALLHLNSRELVQLSEDGELAARMRDIGRTRPVIYLAGYPHGAARQSLDELFKLEVPVRMLYPSGHWPFIDRPEDFDIELSRFLATLELTGPAVPRRQD